MKGDYGYRRFKAGNRTISLYPEAGGRLLIEAADGVMREKAVHSPEHMLALLAPGFGD